MSDNEVEILLVDDNQKEAEKTIDILRKNKLANKLIHLKNGEEASDFVFCKGAFSNRNIQNQPKAILFNVQVPQKNDREFLQKINTDIHTRNISVIVFSSKMDLPGKN